MAYAVGRNVGTAVARNRLRRRLRAIVSDLAAQLPAGAYLVRAGPEAAELRPGELRAALGRAFERAAGDVADLAVAGDRSGAGEPADSRAGSSRAVSSRAAEQQMSAMPTAPDAGVLSQGDGVVEGRPVPNRWVAARLVSAIRAYQLVRTGRPSGCRFLPTCSEYAVGALEAHGTVRGGGLALRRLLRCRPWGGHGVDPVPLDPPPGRSRPREEAPCSR